MSSFTRKFKRNGRTRQAVEMLGEHNDVLRKALQVMNSKEAEAAIGEKPEVLNTLLDGIKGATNLHWAAMRANGVRKSAKVLKMVGQNQVILMTLMMYAFAAGVKHGRENQQDG